MGVLCINQVLDLLLLCAECVPCTVALLLYTGVENECRMAEGVAVLLTQHQRVVVERQDQRGVVVDPVQRPGFLACSGRPPSPAPFWFRFRLHVQNARLGSAPAADPGNVLASVHRLKGQDVPSGGILAGEQPGRSRGAAVSRSGRST